MNNAQRLLAITKNALLEKEKNRLFQEAEDEKVSLKEADTLYASLMLIAEKDANNGKDGTTYTFRKDDVASIRRMSRIEELILEKLKTDGFEVDPTYNSGNGHTTINFHFSW